MQQEQEDDKSREFVSEKNRWSVIDRLYHIPRRNSSHIISKFKKIKIMPITLIVPKTAADHQNQSF